ncbi:MAG TPA: DMT family transporter [Casimicrobiaceae bacterium]|nr:DMT family transporter [Casimicrobiaceae bacterium]
MRQRDKMRAAGMLVFAAVAWGALFEIAKGTLHALDAFWLSAWRYVPAGVLMLGMLWIVEGRRALSLDGFGLRLFLFGALGFAGFSIFVFLGIARSRPEHAAIIVALMPMISALLNWLVHGRRPGAVTLGAIAVALAGVALVITKGRFDRLADGTLVADLLVLAGVVSWVVYTMGASQVPGFSSLRYSAHSMALGGIAILLVTGIAWAAGFSTPPAWHVVGAAKFEIAYLCLIAGVGAVVAWNGGISVLGPANGVLFVNLVPITAFVIAVARGQHFVPVELLGAALVVGALVASYWAARPKVPPPLASPARFA